MTPLWCRHTLFRLFVSFLVLFLFCSEGSAVRAVKSDAQKALDQLYEEALRGPERAVTIDTIISYVQRSDIRFDDQQYAVLTLRKLRAPEAEGFLLDVVEGEIEFPNSDRLKNVARVAYVVTRASAAESREEEIDILLTGLDNAVLRYDSYATRNIIGEFCNLGDEDHFDQVKEIAAKGHIGRNVRETLHFCEEQLRILSYSEDRGDSLLHALSHEDPVALGDPAMNWIIHEIIALDPSAAEEALADYLLRLQDDLELQDSGPYYESFRLLRSFGWTDQQFKDRGITPKWWTGG